MRAQTKSFRSVTAVPAMLRLDDGTTVSCIIKNLSAGGAQIELDTNDDLPGHFHVAAGELDIDADADMMWRQGSLMGIRFLTRQNTAANRAADLRLKPTSPHTIGLAHITSRGRSAAFK